MPSNSVTWRTSTTRDLAEPARELVEPDVAHSARTTSTSARPRAAAELVEPGRDVRGQLDAEHVAGADHPRDVGEVREEALPDRQRLELAGESFGSPRRNA